MNRWSIARAMPGLTCIYDLPVGVPPTGREHFGFRDGIGTPFVIGSGLERTTGAGRDHAGGVHLRLSRRVRRGSDAWP